MRNAILLATDSDSSILLEKLNALTPQGRDVLRWIGIGATNRQIGEQLYILEITVINPRYSPTEPFKLEEPIAAGNLREFDFSSFHLIAGSGESGVA